VGGTITRLIKAFQKKKAQKKRQGRAAEKKVKQMQERLTGKNGTKQKGKRLAIRKKAIFENEGRKVRYK